MSLGKSRPQTDDPGANHGVSGGTTGTHDFSGQDGYNDDANLNDHPDLDNAGFRQLDTSNPCNGSGGSSKTIDPSKVKGINP